MPKHPASQAALGISISAVLLFSYNFLHSISMGLWGFWPALFGLLWLLYIARGGKTVPPYTEAGVFSLFTRELIYEVGPGTHWISPWLEYIGVVVDLRKRPCEIKTTGAIQTRDGIAVRVGDINYFLQFRRGSAKVLVGIQGGADTVLEKVKEFGEELVATEVGKLHAEQLTSGRGLTLKELAGKLKTEVNIFCQRHGYPCEVVDGVTIGETHPDSDWKRARKERAVAQLHADAEDLRAERTGSLTLPAVSVSLNNLDPSPSWLWES